MTALDALYHDGCWMDGDGALVTIVSRPDHELDVRLAEVELGDMPQFNVYASDGCWTEYCVIVKPQRMTKPPLYPPKHYNSRCRFEDD